MPYEPPPAPARSYTVKEAASILRIHPNVVSKKLKEGAIRGVKGKGQWLIAQDEIDRLVLLRFELNANYLSLEAAAERLRVHYQTVWTWLADGRLKAHQDPLSHGGKYFLALKEIETLRRLKIGHDKHIA